ncbi:transcriptional regulator, GntR family [Cohaesibacter sp. ES.047]|uniref:GntR family transcriptional regulator n=1 Tax=Cohaesibacter sp. ES.047 TaxID=1798205 RepID=UPI000BB7DE26|nr:GntR family transcriptional regulator [Cohaesibacter sp. ES.047]SNY93216.1 transcriptional regulator, GntR family [Cohaesibacter sp. ES.047]
MAIDSLQAAPLTIQRTAIADRIFDELQHQILSLDLKPGTKVSEADVAKVFGVSRQPVRNAFFRLSKMGFLDVRPQVASRISFISEEAVLKARFIRCALESKAVKMACDELSEEDIHALTGQIEQQGKAVETKASDLFHRLDEDFHREIYERAGVGFVWDLIKENKAHMDRVRYQSLPLNLDNAFQCHKKILAAIKARDKEWAAREMDLHLSEIFSLLKTVREEYPEYFEEETA